MARILVFDNYDSFTYNLVHIVEKILHVRVAVFRNDEIPLEKVGGFDKIILSPGPGLPSEAGLLLPLVREYASTKSILGVCLGHQAIAEAFGGSLINLDTVYHGVASTLAAVDTDNIIFKDIAPPVTVGRYHSWVVSPLTLPAELRVTATDEHGHIMAFEHRAFDVQGVQFHPESVLTPNGEQMLRNWLRM